MCLDLDHALLLNAWINAQVVVSLAQQLTDVPTDIPVSASPGVACTWRCALPQVGHRVVPQPGHPAPVFCA